jgi:hypothetical protein
MINVPIAMHMGMTPMIASHFTYSYDMVSHKTPMMVKARILGRLEGGLGYKQQKVGNQISSMPIQHHGS